ncbi:MAG: flagellar hook-length control protein FliK [Desulfobulbaceae bacterium]|nr:flagellar hook-length control protein FliK [Desulfobulbaceae bacterium]
MKIDSRLPTKTDPAASPKTNGTTPAETGKPGGGMTLTVGTVLKGTVLEITADGKALLDIAGRTVTARTMVPLKPGAELYLEVKEGGAMPWLTQADKKGGAQELIRLLFTEGANLAKAATLLAGGGESAAAPPTALPASLLEALAAVRGEIADKATSGQAESGKLSQLLALLRPSGSQAATDIPLSKKLSAVADRLAAQLGPDHASANEIKAMAKLLDAHQQINARPSGNQPDFLIFPCFFTGNAGWGEWLFSMETSGGKEAEEPPCTIDFFLRMSRLGDVHLKVLLQGESLRGDFLVGEETVRRHLADAIPELAAILAGHGFQPVALTARQATENPLHTFRKELETKARLRPFALIDLTA